MSISRSPKLKLQAALFDLIEICEDDEAGYYAVTEIWDELDQTGQEIIWRILSSNQQKKIREALAMNPDNEDPLF